MAETIWKVKVVQREKSRGFFYFSGALLCVCVCICSFRVQGMEINLFLKSCSIFKDEKFSFLKFKFIFNPYCKNMLNFFPHFCFVCLTSFFVVFFHWVEEQHWLGFVSLHSDGFIYIFHVFNFFLVYLSSFNVWMLLYFFCLLPRLFISLYEHKKFLVNRRKVLIKTRNKSNCWVGRKKSFQ